MPEVTFNADTTRSSPPADAWSWQAWISWYLRLAIALTLLVAGCVASVFTLSWNIQWADIGGGIVLTSFLIGLMPARHYFQNTHPGLAKFTLVVWVVVSGMSIVAATSAISPSNLKLPDTIASLDHEIELCNARNYPPRRVLENMRSRAVQFCPDYEQWFTKVFHTPACMDARMYEEDLKRLQRCHDADAKIIDLERHPQQRAVASLWPAWGYLAQEARLLPMRILFVLVTGMAFWGFVEAMNVILTEQRSKVDLPPPSAMPQFGNMLGGMNEGFDVWLRDCVGKQGGNVLTASEVYSHYAQWVTRVLRLKQEEVLSATAFHAMMRPMFTSNGKQYSGIVIHDAQGIWNDIEKMKEA